jgi:hypothetical protein
VVPDDEDEDEDLDDPDGPGESKKAVLIAEPGVQRFVWDLRYRGPEKIRKAKIDAGELEVGPMAAPGTYKARLTVNGRSYTTNITVALDPRLTAGKNSPDAQSIQRDIKSQLQLVLKSRDDITTLSRDVRAIRAIRKQLEDRNVLLKEHKGAEDLVKNSAALVEKLNQIEEKLHNPKAEATYDILAQKGGARLYSQLGMIYEELKNSDNAPTQGMKERSAELSQELQTGHKELAAVLAGDLAKLNELAQKLKLPTIYVPTYGKD